MVSDDKVEVYSCYGNTKHIVLNGRVFNNIAELKYKKNDGYFINIKNKLSQIFNDEKKNEPVTITINQNIYKITSDEEGYFDFELSTYNKQFYHNQQIEVSVNSGKTVSKCNTFIPTEDKQIGVISDFDDTLIISGVTNKLNLLNNLFLKNYKQRTLIKETKNIINEIIGDKNRAFFIITGSPKQLHNSIDNFLNYHNFPKRTIITKKLHGENSDPIFDQLEYKFEKVRDIILLYPHIKWVLIGDSGERDKGVYEKIYQAYPNSIKNIYIRNVNTNKITQLMLSADYFLQNNRED